MLKLATMLTLPLQSHDLKQETTLCFTLDATEKRRMSAKPGKAD